MMGSTLRILSGIACITLFGGLAVLTALDQNPHVGFSLERAREVRANTSTASDQHDPTLAVDAEGRILVTWTSRRQEFGDSGVFAQLLDPLGRRIGTEIHVNQQASGDQHESYVGFSPDGTGWVTWSSVCSSPPRNGIFLRRLADSNRGFSPIGDEIMVSGKPHRLYSDPALAINGEGVLLVAYVRNDRGQPVVLGRLLSPEGVILGDAFQLDGPDRQHGRVPDVVAVPGGSFIAVWQRSDYWVNPLGLVGRCISSDGSLGELLQMSDLPDRQHVEPSLDVDGFGRILLAWMSASDGEGDWEVRARRFADDLQPLGPSFAVDAGGEQRRNGATALCAADGRFLVAYNAHGTAFEGDVGRLGHQSDIRAQVFGRDGDPLCEGFQVNPQEQGRHAMQVARNGRHAEWTENRIILVWSGIARGDDSGVTLQALVPEDDHAWAPPIIDAPLASSELHGIMEAVKAAPVQPPGWMTNLQRVPPTRDRSGSGFAAHNLLYNLNPPDPDLAVGPDMIVSQCNREIAAFSKDGVEMWRQKLHESDGFYGSVGGTWFIFDPVSLYDWHSERFIVASAERDYQTTSSYVCFAVSKDSHPEHADDWWKYRALVSPQCESIDFPNLGVNRGYIYVTFLDALGSDDHLAIFDKAAVTNGALAPWWLEVIPYTTADSFGNTKNYDANNVYQFFVTSPRAGGNSISLYCKQTPVSSWATITLPVTVWSTPEDAPQQGTSSRLDVLDARIKNGVVRNGRLYCAHGVRTGDLSSGFTTKVRWYEIDLGNWPNSGGPTLLQEGTLDLGAGVYSWMPDICPDADRNITLAYYRSAATEVPSIESAYRLVSDPPGMMRSPMRLRTSTIHMVTDRWGDYAGIDEDPAAPGTFWGHLEYSIGSWETWIDRWVVSNPGVPFGGGGVGYPCPCNNNNDGSLAPLLAGCGNGEFSSGANLSAHGTPSVSSDTLVLTGTNVNSNTWGFFFQGNNQALPGTPMDTVANGLLQVSGSIKRFGVVQVDASGFCNSSSYPIVYGKTISSWGEVSAGDTRSYQLWYRNPAAWAPCTPGDPGGSNTTNGYTITWLP